MFQDDKPLPGKNEKLLDGEQELLEAVKADPNNDELRAIYADWLESQEDVRSEFLRLEIEIHSIELDDNEDPEAETIRRFTELADRVSEEWLLQVLRGKVQNCLESCERHWFEFKKLDGDYPKHRFCEECSRPVRACVRESDVNLSASIERALYVANSVFLD